MAVCDYCNQTFRLFGVYRNGYTCCSGNCADQLRVLKVLDQYPKEEIDQYVEHAHKGPCPQCGNNDRNDIHNSYRVASFLILTRWSTHTHFVSRQCAQREQYKAIGFSFLAGWWGVPFGLILTPVQIIRNIAAIMARPDPSRPSDRMQKVLKLNLARRIASNRLSG